jgi:hypothetical protein
MDLEIKKQSWFKWLPLTFLLLDENNAIGMRFEALYRSDRDKTCECPADANTTAYHQFINTHLSRWYIRDENTYTVFRDEDHGNMQVF